MRSKTPQKNKGFTLIELLVVIAIIGILSSIILASLRTAKARASDAARISEIHQVKVALEEYSLTNNSYPNPGSSNVAYDLATLNTLPNPLSRYMKTLPTEKLGAVNYVYVYGSPTSYGILVTLQSGYQCVTGQNVDANWFAQAGGRYSLTFMPRCTF